MQLVGTRGQRIRDLTLDASGTIAVGGTPQLILPERKSTSVLIIQNISTYPMFLGIGSATATSALTSGSVSGISVSNGGFGFTYAPNVQLLGGGAEGWNTNDGGYLGAGIPGYAPPDHVAQAHAVISGGAVTSIVVDYPGSGYVYPPFVYITNSLRDPFGCTTPSATSGFLLSASGGNLSLNGTSCFTDPVSVFCSTTGAAYTAKWLP